MAITVNNTLPNDWNESTIYHEGDLVVYAYIIYRCTQTSTNNRPDISKDYWQPLEIYLKDATVMDHGQYSGDEEFWNRDNIYIDSAGWVYVNNENTGINVRGPAGTTHVDFDSLTPAQKEEIRGPQGNEGPQGPVGPIGPQGPMGEVDLTPEQIAALKGEDGKSTYEIWLEEGHTGTPADFLAWVRDGRMLIDNELDLYSENPVQNKVITQNLQTFRANYAEKLEDLTARVTQLENRLKYSFEGEDKYFRFGITTEGKYGYFYNNSETIIPFDHTNTEHLISNQSIINDGNFNSRIAEEGILQQDSPNVLTGVISEPATAVNIIDFFPSSRIYIYKDGRFITDALPNFEYSLYHMDYNLSNPQETTNLLSYGQPNSTTHKYGEGIVIPSAAFNNQAYNITFTIKIFHRFELTHDEPLEYETLYLRMCTFTGSVTLPDAISSNQITRTKYINHQHGKQDGSDLEATISIPFYIDNNEGIFLASYENQHYNYTGEPPYQGDYPVDAINPNATAKYQIEEIYLDVY